MKRFDQDSLGQRLHAEGRAGASADFSGALHARVMEALRTRGLKLEGAGGAREWGGAWLWRIGVPVGVAAAVGVAAWMTMKHMQEPEGPSRAVARAPLPEMPSMEPVRQAITVPAEEFNLQKFGHLDRDAQRLAVFVTNQVPDFSTRRP